MITDSMTPEQNNKGKMRGNDDFVISTPFSDIHCAVHYADKNPRTAIESISDALAYIGVFEGIE